MPLSIIELSDSYRVDEHQNHLLVVLLDSLFALRTFAVPFSNGDTLSTDLLIEN